MVEATDFQAFYPRVSILILTRDIDIANLSVRPSVTFRYCMKRAKNVVIVFFINHSSFTSIKHHHEIPTETLPAGALNTSGV